MLLRRESTGSIRICNRSPHPRRFIVESLNGSPLDPPLGFDFAPDQERTVTFTVRQESMEYVTRPPGDTFWFNASGHWIQQIEEPPPKTPTT
jgi:hypothetical protein